MSFLKGINKVIKPVLGTEMSFKQPKTKEEWETSINSVKTAVTNARKRYEELQKKRKPVAAPPPKDTEKEVSSFIGKAIKDKRFWIAVMILYFLSRKK